MPPPHPQSVVKFQLPTTFAMCLLIYKDGKMLFISFRNDRVVWPHSPTVLKKQNKPLRPAKAIIKPKEYKRVRRVWRELLQCHRPHAARRDLPTRDHLSGRFAVRHAG